METNDSVGNRLISNVRICENRQAMLEWHWFQDPSQQRKDFNQCVKFLESIGRDCNLSFRYIEWNVAWVIELCMRSSGNACHDECLCSGPWENFNSSLFSETLYVRSFKHCMKITSVWSNCKVLAMLGRWKWKLFSLEGCYPAEIRLCIVVTYVNIDVTVTHTNMIIIITHMNMIMNIIL